jgi:hypothetical protein
MGRRSPHHLLVVVPVTRQPAQPDLFGGTHRVDQQHPGTRPGGPWESNDIDLMHTIAGNAVRCGYLLVGASERVYTRTDGSCTGNTGASGDEVVRVPRYEDDAVHQLLRRRWLTRGSTHAVNCGAVSLHGIALLVPKHTRDAVTRWEYRQRPPSWPQRATTTSTASTAGARRVVRLDDERRRRR